MGPRLKRHSINVQVQEGTASHPTIPGREVRAYRAWVDGGPSVVHWTRELAVQQLKSIYENDPHTVAVR